jgi:hypothetical protein
MFLFQVAAMAAYSHLRGKWLERQVARPAEGAMHLAAEQAE